MNNPMVLPALATILALIVYLVLGINVGRARARYKVPLPQITGNPDFERVYRVHQNTLEQIVIFVPALWVFSTFVSPLWGAALGWVWIVGRIVYAWGYYQAVEKRSVGFGISMLGTMGLLLGSLVGCVLALLR